MSGLAETPSGAVRTIRQAGAATVLVAVLLAGVGVGVAHAAFVATTANTGNSFAAVPDFVAPLLGASTAAETAAGGMAQHVHPGSAYQIYGGLTDTGNPASGVATVTANVSSLTTGGTSAAMPAGAFSFAGTSYSNRSGSLTANATLAACSYTPTITATDGAGNAGTTNASKVMVDRDLLNQYHIRIDGSAAGDNAGQAVAGDVNGDGRTDLLLGANFAANNSRTASGSAYILASPSCS